MPTDTVQLHRTNGKVILDENQGQAEADERDEKAQRTAQEGIQSQATGQEEMNHRTTGIFPVVFFLSMMSKMSMIYLYIIYFSLSPVFLLLKHKRS